MYRHFLKPWYSCGNDIGVVYKVGILIAIIIESTIGEEASRLLIAAANVNPLFGFLFVLVLRFTWGRTHRHEAQPMTA